MSFDGKKIFSGFFSMVYEDIWFDHTENNTVTIVDGAFQYEVPEERKVKYKKVQYGLAVHMFYARDMDDAFKIAKHMMEGFHDANHDGDGDLYQEYCRGLIDLDEVFIPSDSSVDSELQDLYGLTVGGVYDLQDCAGPKVKLKAKAVNEHLYFKG